MQSEITPSLAAQNLGVKIISCTPEECVLTLPVAGNTQPAGFLHGGINAFLVEEAASRAANMQTPPGYRCVGVDLNVTHLRPATSGIVTATATLIRRGKTISVYQVDIRSENGRQTATGRLTLQMVNIEK